MNRKAVLGYLYISPLLIGVLLFAVYPAVQVIWMSFHEIELANLREARFVGLENYISIFQADMDKGKKLLQEPLHDPVDHGRHHGWLHLELSL
jgi:ABC-type sugar transport system permease subunit